jgi:hypothetical protein
MYDQNDVADDEGNYKSSERYQHDVVIQFDFQLVDDIVETASNLPFEHEERRLPNVVGTVKDVSIGANWCHLCQPFDRV